MLMAVVAQASIVEDSFWDSHNWDNAAMELSVVKGKVTGSSEASNSFITSSHSIPGHPNNYSSLANVVRASSNFSESTWEDMTENASSIYSYDDFLKAVAKFPSFCGETMNPLGYNEDETCSREIAALFAHMTVTSDGLSKREDTADTSNFRARGPLGLKGEADYKAFSAVFYEGFDRSDELFNEPERVANDGYVGLAAAIWKYMTPSSPSPSMHSIMTGFYEPNAGDL